MKSRRHSLDADWQDLVIVIAGLWLFFSPFLLQYISSSPPAAGTSFLIGSLLTGIAMIGLSIHQLWEEWLNLVMAVFLIISPWVLQFTTETLAMWNVIIVGLVVTMCTLWVLIQGLISHYDQLSVARENPA